MFELITQILLLVGLYYLVRAIWPSIYNPKYFAWFGVAVFIALVVMAFAYPTNRTVGILWAVLSFPLRPLGLTLILLGFALSEGLQKVKGQQVLAAFLILLISSLPITAYLLTAQTEQRSVIEAIRRQEASNPREVQAIVVLGDGSAQLDPASRIRTQVTRPGEGGISITLQSRLLYAAELYNNRTQRGSNPLVIVSIGPQPLDIRGRPLPGEGEAVILLLTSHGVPQSQIKLDTEGIDPRSSAIAVRRILLGPKGENVDCRIFAVCDDGFRELPTTGTTGPRIPIVLVSPAIMIRRASSSFTRVFFEVTPRPTDFYSFQLQRGWDLAALTALVPSAEALVITSRVVNEYLTTVYYFLRGWLADPLAV
ncbi:MAG: YdcF family protein [Cyanobacteria bacterium RM1_2_2]|nr:YdcF family protein [Cyanobacteria bacterium RM1_2_2]